MKSIYQCLREAGEDKLALQAITTAEIVEVSWGMEIKERGFGLTLQKTVHSEAGHISGIWAQKGVPGKIAEGLQ